MAEYIDHPTKRYPDGSPVMVLAEHGQFIEQETLSFDAAKRQRRTTRFYKGLGQRPLSMWPKMKSQRFSLASSDGKAGK